MASNESEDLKGEGPTTLFSKRDKERHEANFEEESSKSSFNLPVKNITFLILFIALSLFYWLFQPVNILFLSSENLFYFFSASSQTLGAILGLIFTATLIIIQMNVNKYGKILYDRILRNNIFQTIVGFYLLTIILSIFSILFPNNFPQTPIWAKGIGYLVFLNLITFPFLVKHILSLLQEGAIFSDFYEKIMEDIKNSEGHGAEKHLASLIHATEEGIKNRESQAIKEGIKNLHDVIKYAIRNSKEVTDSLERGNYGQERPLAGGSGGFLKESIEGMINLHNLLLDSDQASYVNFAQGAYNSCATESLRFVKDNSRSLDEMMKGYQDLLIKCTELDKSRRRSFGARFRDFTQKAFRLDETDFRLSYESTLCDPDFLEELMTDDPWILGMVVSGCTNAVKRVNTNHPFGPVNPENIKSVIRILLTYMDVSDNIIKSYNEELKRKKNSLKNFRQLCRDRAYLLTLYCLRIDEEDIASQCKKLLKDNIDFEEMKQKIYQEVDPDNDYRPRFNRDVHFLFTEIKEDNDWDFNYKKLKQEAETLSELQ